ncbi:MAG: head GIN domain-containing protein [bacterium]
MRFLTRFGLLMSLIAVLFVSGTATDWLQFNSGRTIKGSGDITAEEREIGDFDRIDTYIGADLTIEIGSPTRLTVAVDDNLQELIRTEVHGHTLTIDSEGSWSTRKGCEIRITVPSLKEIRSFGSGYIEVKKLSGELFSFELDGSGDFWADGEIQELEIELNGSGNVDTRDLQARDVYVSINGSGDAEVMALDSFDGRINGSGNITYYGKPEDVSRSVNGSGRIRAR